MSCAPAMVASSSATALTPIDFFTWTTSLESSRWGVARAPRMGVPLSAPDLGADHLSNRRATSFSAAAAPREAAEPVADAQKRYVLKAPIAVGTAWQATTTAYLLRRR